MELTETLKKNLLHFWGSSFVVGTIADLVFYFLLLERVLEVLLGSYIYCKACALLNFFTVKTVMFC